MENQNTIKVALVRGDSLNNWEGKLWENLADDILVSAFCCQKNLYPFDLTYSVKRLPSSSDHFITRQFDKFLFGRFLPMNGLEVELAGFDIAHTAELSYWFTNQAVRAKKLNPKLKVVATVWDNSFGRFEYNYWTFLKMVPAWWRATVRAGLLENIQGVDLFLPITQYSADMLLDYGVPKEKIKILTPAIIMPENSESAEELLAKFNLIGKTIYMVVNRMVKQKGVYDVLYAWRIFCREHDLDKNRLVVIGGGPERANAMRMIKEWGLDQTVVFIERLPNEQVRALFPCAKALILASLPDPLWQEQFGFVLAEAISSNCPVVSTYSGAIPEVIENAGILFTPGNPPDLVRALNQLDEEDCYAKLKLNCGKVKLKFNDESFRTELVKIYRSILSK